MKFNFKKISAMAGVFLAGTFAFAGAINAASYPSPFQDNVANTAIVYGSDALDTDESVANSIQADLAEYADESSSSGSTVSLGNESAPISEKGNDLTFGESFNNVTTSLDDGDLSTLLAEETVVDDSVDYSETETVNYFQTIDLSSDSVGFGSLNDDEYVTNADAASDELPVLHVDQHSGEAYNLTVDFSTAINASAYDDSETLTIASKDLVFDQEMSQGDTELILYESSETVSLAQGESATVDGKTVEITGGDSGTANLKIDGNIYSVSEGDSEEGFYVNKVVDRKSVV